jgi:hypothetical protein
MRHRRTLPALLALTMVMAMTRPDAQGADAPLFLPEAAAAEAKAALLQAHGEGERPRFERGVEQVRLLWRAGDGDAAAFQAFVKDEFLPRGERLDAAFARLEFALERLGGYFTSLVRDLRQGADLEIGPLVPLDERLAGFDPSAHLSEDLFQSRIAFVALLNFPLATLDQRMKEGGGWSRRQWAETRLAQRFDTRVPAEVNAATAQAYAEAGAYIAAYNVYTHHLLTPDGQRLFPAGQRLLSHWNLRDEIKARYSDPDGAPRQRLIAKVMDAIVQQTIPAAVVNNPLLDWTPETGAVAVSPVKDAEPPAGAKATPAKDREDDQRYRKWMRVFQAERQADPHHPRNPTFIDRRFNVSREIPEAEVQALLETVLASPLAEPTARLIEKRLGRKLEPFDIWYAGFKPRAKHTEADLDAMTRQRYPTAADYAADIPRLLKGLGFTEEKARFLAERIVVEPARGSGHAFGAARRDDKAHLRTRIASGGMDYKGYNIAIHEMGHNVEQVFSVSTIDHTLLLGVPNNAFTEALAFVFQARDLPLLGLGEPDAEAQRLRALEEFWATREIAAVGLVDMAAWRWLYAHPDATPAQFREAVVGISKDVWNRHFAGLFGQRDVTLLGIYSHAVDSGLYLPDYGLGHLIAFQIEEHFAKVKGPMGPEFERVSRLGSITPDAWMRKAVGGPLSAQPLLDAAQRALAATR